MSADAGQILEEIYAVLERHHCLMSARPEGFVLARLSEHKGGVVNAEAIAVVGQISVDGIDYKPCGRVLRANRNS
jgi:hypothetical protein